MATDGSPSPATPDKSQEVVDHVVWKVELTEPQKLVLKDKVKDTIARTTSLNIANFNAELVKELEAQKSTSDKTPGTIEDAEIHESVDTAEKKVSAPAEAATPAEAAKAKLIESATWGLAAVVWVETAEAIVKDIQNGGIMNSIQKFIYEIKSFFSSLFSKKKPMSYETYQIYTNCIEKQLQDIRVLPPTTTEDWESRKIDIASGEHFMEKITAAGIPLENADLYLPFVTNPDSDITKIPEKLRPIFEAWKAHYTALDKSFNTENPQGSIDAIFDFTVPETPAAPTGPAAAPAESAPATPAIESVKFKDGDKEIALEAAPESVTSFQKIQKTAETILGKDALKVEEILKTHHTANTETDPKKKWEAVLKSVAIEITKKVRNATAILGQEKIEKVTKDGKEISIADDSFTGDLLPAIEVKLQAYIPLAFKELSNTVSTTVKDLLIDLEKKLSWLKPEDYEKIREKIKTSVIGSYIESGQVNAATFVEKTKTGYDEVMRDILKQAEKLQNIKSVDLPTILKMFPDKSPLELS